MANSSEKPKPPSDKGGLKEIGFKLPDWFDITVWLGIATVLAFSTSWIYVPRFESALNLDLARYFDTLDYVQITPIGGSSFIVVLSIALSVGVCLLSGIRKFLLALNRPVLLWTIGAIAAFLFLVHIYQFARCQAHQLELLPPSEITLKGGQPAIQGRVICSLNRYLLVFGEHRLLIAIPQAEIQKIQTPRGQIRPPKPSISKVTSSLTTPAS
jgi:hypothetical protein